MTQCAMLDSLGEDDFHSSEGFAEWSTFSPVHCSEEKEDGSFGNWSSFHCGLKSESKELESAPLSAQERGRSDHRHKVGDEDTPWFLFSDCFRVEETVKDTPEEILPLSQILLNSAHTPPQPALSRESLNLCHRLLCEPHSVSLSSPRLNSHSYKWMINTLQLKHSDTDTSQSTDLSDLEAEETESSPANLIQTKLMAPMWCRNKPGYLYQISHQWLNQNSLRLLPH